MGSNPRIAVDAMGGDFAPDEVVAGAIMAQQALEAEILLVGDPTQVEAAIQKHPTPPSMEIVAASDVIDMHEEPLSALKRKPQASINVAMELVKRREADAVISAGHSGAAMASALLRLGRLPGVDRPAIGALFPTFIEGKSVLILDVGANVDCRPKFLDQFAVMGTIYSKHILGIDAPKVGLLNIGEEPSKGNDQAVRTHQILAENSQISFVGNAEGRDILSGEFDVIVCDGFTGNVLLKFAEAVGNVVLQVVQQEFAQGLDQSIDMDLWKSTLRRIRQRIDHVEHGGGLLLGVDGICIISHGSSKATSIFNAIRIAKSAADGQVLAKMQSQYRQDIEPSPLSGQ